MVDALAGSRSLLLLNFRPEYHAEWMQKSWYRQIPLTPLGGESIADLLADLLGNDPSIAALAGPIHARTAGNPFFTEEVAQSLIESGQLVGNRGAYRLVTSIERLEMPATVQAVVAARIDRLPEREKRLLQVASVIGKEFSEALLAAVAELPADELKAALAALQRAEFIHEQALYPVAEYAFKHPLTQEVALGSQLRERRRRVHGVLARAIEQQDAEHLDERAALLAYHSEEAGESLSAARWHRRAAMSAGRTDLGSAMHHWRRVRLLSREIPDDREAAELGIAACTQLLGGSWRLGMGLDDARALLEEGQTLANATGDRRGHLNLSILFGRAVGGTGAVAANLELAVENRRVALEIGEIGVQAFAWSHLCTALFFAARLPEALQIAEAGLARFPRHISSEDLAGINPYTLLSMGRGNLLNWTGRLRAGLEACVRCLSLAEEDGTPEVAGWVLYNAAGAYYFAHDADRALASARQLEEICRRLGEPSVMRALTQVAFGYAHLAAGRAAEAIEPARTALDIYGRVDRAQAGMSATLLAEALLQAGDLSRAEAAAADAIAVCQRLLRGNFEAVAHGVLARAILRRDGAAARDDAEAALANAAALIERTGARTLAPALCEWRAELAAVLGDDAMRNQLLRQAEQLYEEIGAPLHAARLAKERAG
jgi:adenylate cyclase